MQLSVLISLTVSVAEKDSIEHMFRKCACIIRFWTSLETILKEKYETALNVKFTQNVVLFGT